MDVFFDQARRGETITIWGDGNQVRDYIHISDVIDFLMLAIEKESLSGIYNVGTGLGASLNGIVELIAKTLEKEPTVVYKSQRNVDVPYSVLNIEKAESVGWLPKIELPCGIQKLLE